MLLALAVTLSVLANAPAPAEPPAELHVSAASSLTDVIQEAASAWGKAGGQPVVFNFGASSLLARQIEEGAPADLFLSADQAKMDDLDKKGLVDGSTRKSLLSNTLVIVVSREGGADVKTAEDLGKAAVRSIAIGEPRSVPVGIYAREYLTRKKLWDALQPKVVPTENVRAALAAVESGNADAAIVYKTDALVSKKVRVAVEVPAAEGPSISYPVAVLKEAKNAAAARAFLAFLQSPAGLEIFRRYGFRIP